jgi:hypothetical protein
MDNKQLIDLMRPYDIGSEKVRLGSNQDGGYVINDIALSSASALFTYGVGGDTSYEVAFNERYGKPVYLFDHTIGAENWDKGDLHFVNEGLGIGVENCGDFVDHYDKLGLTEKVLFKLDIEGAEWDYFLNADIGKIADRSTGIILEIHWFQDALRMEQLPIVMEKILSRFVLTHVHGNNWGGEHGGNEIFPRVMELSFVNKTLVTTSVLDTTTYPTIYDRPNRGDVEDCPLNYLKS